MNQHKKYFINFRDQKIEITGTDIEILRAFYIANRIYTGCGKLTFNALLDLLNHDPVTDGDEYGWDQYIFECYYGDSSWIDFNIITLSNTPELYLIYFPVPPHPMEEEKAINELDDLYKEEIKRI